MSKSVGWQNEHCSREQETQFMLWVALSRPCHSLGLGAPWQRELLGWMISEDCGFILWYPQAATPWRKESLLSQLYPQCLQQY